jgi:hypothetical protein
MDKADEFLSNKGIYHNVKYSTEDGEFWLTELLEQYAQQISKGAVTDYAKFINPDGYKRDIVIFNLGRLNHEQI